MEEAIGWLQRNSGHSEEGRVSKPEVDSCSVRRRSRFPLIAGLLVLSSGCWVHDGFQLFWLVRRPDAKGGSPQQRAFGVAPHLEC